MHHSVVTDQASGEYRITQCGESILEDPITPTGDPHGPIFHCPLCGGEVNVG